MLRTQIEVAYEAIEKYEKIKKRQIEHGKVTAYLQARGLIQKVTAVDAKGREKRVSIQGRIEALGPLSEEQVAELRKVREEATSEIDVMLKEVVTSPYVEENVYDWRHIIALLGVFFLSLGFNFWVFGLYESSVCIAGCLAREVACDATYKAR